MGKTEKVCEKKYETYGETVLKKKREYGKKGESCCRVKVWKKWRKFTKGKKYEKKYAKERKKVWGNRRKFSIERDRNCYAE